MTKTLIATMLASLVALGAAIANAADAPMHPVATCRDGKTYYRVDNEHRGACSGHGGVAKWSDGSPVRGKGPKKSETK